MATRHPRVVYTQEQMAAWRLVTDAVHGLNNADGSLPVAPSAIRYEGKVYTPGFEPRDPEVPRALEPSEIHALIISFTQAAKNAMAAGFDGIELQGANGHLIDQFLCDGSNQRTDAYGGAIARRARFLLDIVDSIIAVIGSNRLGVRLSPFGRYGGISDKNPIDLFTYVSQELSRRKIAYLKWDCRRGRVWPAVHCESGPSGSSALRREAQCAGPSDVLRWRSPRLHGLSDAQFKFCRRGCLNIPSRELERRSAGALGGNLFAHSE
jgi:2,4-dienoyl-CoA reductase-like NADH-dependent reductase (Old Yellow Enzyme family)